MELLLQDYKNEMAAMSVERDQLISRGHRLMVGSSEIRANDIEYKIKRLMDKWQRLEGLMTARSVRALSTGIGPLSFQVLCGLRFSQQGELVEYWGRTKDLRPYLIGFHEY